MKTYLQTVDLENFRNVEKASLSFDRDLTILYGDNAQGKTNVIESIYLFATGKSFRGAKDKDMIRFGTDRAQVHLTYADRLRDNEITYRFFSEESRKKREITVNHVKMKSVGQMIGHFRAVLFCPEHLSIVKDEPSLRRNFLDHAICQLKPTYVQALAEYAKILDQRNALIRDFEQYPPEQWDALLSVINEKFADTASFITVTRAKYLKKLFDFADRYMRDMTGEREKLTYGYQNSVDDRPDPEDYDFAAVKNRYAEKLTSRIEREKLAGVSLCGVHRDDFSILLNDKAAKLFASQGQQRSIALAMKLAEGELSMEYAGDYPVFLLDDVLSELDRKRKDYILSGFGDRQIILTTCDKSDFSTSESAMKIETKNGSFSVS